MVYRTDLDQESATALAGPFTLREVVVMAGGVLLLLGSVLPFQVAGTYLNIWGFSALVFNQFVSLALPLLVAGAFAWRRMTGRRLVRVGSMTLDQLGSVVAVLTVLYFFLGTVMSMNAAFLLGLVGALALLAGTTSASVIPGFAADFEPGDGPLLTRPVRAAVPSRRPEGGKGNAAKAGASAPKSWLGAGAASGSGSTPPVATDEAQATASNAEAAASPDQSGAPAFFDGRSGAGPEAPAASGLAPSAGDVPAGPSAGEGTHAPEADSGETQSRAAAESDAPESAPESDAGVTAASNDRSGVAVPTGEHGLVAGPATVAQPRADAAAPSTVAQARIEPAAPRTDEAPVSTPDDDEPFEASRDAEEGPAYQAFWFAVPRPRDVYDERTGRTVFTAEPGAWILALEDRGHEYLVQDTDGRIGVLRDLANVERA